jgi:hypothetical protein
MRSVRLSAEIEARVRRVAALRGLPISEVHRRALEEYCERQLDAGRTSRYDDVIGVAEGPADLAERATERLADLLAERRG